MATVVIADDLAQVRALLKACLEPSGHTVLVADGGEAALTLCRDHRADLLLIDRSMPDLDGLETVRIFRATHPQAPTRIVLMTGDDIAHAPSEIMRTHGIHRTLRKPFGVSEVRQAIEAELAALHTPSLPTVGMEQQFDANVLEPTRDRPQRLEPSQSH